MRYAIISDIHANRQAWTAVLKDIREQGADEILCLGDVVGYGPSPADVLESVYEQTEYFVLGNHDAVIGDRLDSDLFNEKAKYIIEWTKERLSKDVVDFFSDMAMMIEGENFSLAHAELALPNRFGYIFEPEEARESLDACEQQLIFVGHTHFPCTFALNEVTGEISDQGDSDLTALNNMRYLCNVGSVGDPRNGDPRASYVIYDQDTQHVSFRKIPFDIEGYRNDLRKNELKIKPFFLRHYDHQVKIGEAVPDMQIVSVEKAKKRRKASKQIKINNKGNKGKVFRMGAQSKDTDYELDEDLHKKKNIRFSRKTITRAKRDTSVHRHTTVRMKGMDESVVRPPRKHVSSTGAKVFAVILAFVILIMGIISGYLLFTDSEPVEAPIDEKVVEIRKKDPPKTLYSENLITDSSFESSKFKEGTKDTMGWHWRQWNGLGSIALSNQSKTGKKSVMISSSLGSDFTYTYRLKVKKGQKYRITCWVKTDNIVPVKSKGKAGVGVLLVIDLHGKQLRSEPILKGSNNWTFTSKDFVANTDKIAINCCIGGWGNCIGTAWFDDISLVEIIPPKDQNK